MKAFRVVVDGQASGDLGVANYGGASVIIHFGRRAEGDPIDITFHVGGLTLPDESDVCWHYRWAQPKVQTGSRIEIEIVDSDNCVPPTKAYRSDHQVQESSFTEEELRALRYEDYLILKQEFEPNS